MTTQLNLLLEMEEKYSNPAYWQGGLKEEGYRWNGYQDFTVNAFKAQRIIDLKPEGSVLDVGCAAGYIVARLRKAGVAAYGKDISSYALAMAPEEAKAYVTRGWAHDLHEWPDQSVDIITTFGVLEHLSNELLDITLAEFQRVAKRGLMSITMAHEPTAHHGDEHPNLKSYSWWRKRLPAHWELWSDYEEGWAGSYSNHIIIVAPTIYPVSPVGRYGGVERLASLLSTAFSKYATVQLVAPEGSKVIGAVQLVETGPALPDFAEPNLKPTMTRVFYPPGTKPPDHVYPLGVIDLSHSKPTAEFVINVPSMAVIWHDPLMMRPVQPKLNVCALSNWQAQRFRMIYGQDARVLSPICADSEFYSPGPPEAVEDRFITIGKLHPSKGVLEAIRACRTIGARLDIVGPVVAGDPADYIQAVMAECDQDQIIYWGEVDDQAKRALLRKARALLYPVSYPEGQGESHSHKMIEAMVMGVPCLALNQGAMSEVIDEGTTGFLAWTLPEFAQRIQETALLDREMVRQQAISRFSVDAVVQEWWPVLQEVCKGARW